MNILENKKDSTKISLLFANKTEVKTNNNTNNEGGYSDEKTTG